MSCVTPHLYNSVAVYQYQRHQHLQQHPHLLARPLLLCQRLPSVVGQYGAVSVPSGPDDPYQRLAAAQPPRNPSKPLTKFSIADILRDGQAESPSPPSPVVHARQVRDEGGRRSPDSTLRPRRPCRTPPTISRPWDDDQLPSRRHSTSDDDCDDDIGDDDEEDIEVDDVESSRLTSSSSIVTAKQHITASKSTSSVCPLDALLRMTSQPFDDTSPGQTLTQCIIRSHNFIYYNSNCN